MLSRANSCSSKASVAFIMNSSENAVDNVPDASEGPGSSNAKVRQTRSPARKSRECKVEGCENYIINKGLCFRHGGGKKCSAEGCTSSAKNAGLCWRHGGWVKCQMEGCKRRGKSRGLCWSHGGGTKCSLADCSKVAVSNSRCWAHGGGKRCVFEGCNKAAYERNQNYCSQHIAKRQRDHKAE
ncbi:hypothetical protein PR003_g15487 [Phytophthora rubi]|uniref:WRKY19-like zinc finger domain-containing protein n=1 Tax=Phytophthora rubi TaxID=129364 RepID=A0A6A3LPL5_9STRA|nr:hypothetical protein PR002_g14061 [Phytophthora rubi]KAE9020108.1 hypothetical protein PR001_g13687 [Phytophthora rubi]KAE9329701.1 hypothetical protein PR003_g15487 [Phytophthora rubi]